MCRAVSFREDLYHRLNVIRIELPPLRARSEDIPELLDHYLHVAAMELGVEPKASPAEALARARPPTAGRETFVSWSTCAAA